jgi:hypothetical protein
MQELALEKEHLSIIGTSVLDEIFHPAADGPDPRFDSWWHAPEFDEDQAQKSE